MTINEASHPGGPVTVEQLIALNDEVAALVRAGVPLERGLIDAGRDLGGRLGTIAQELGDRLGEGDSLPEALGRSGHATPEIYRAVVEAGIRSGRLSSALETMATLSRNYVEARRSLGLALLYPLLVVSLAYVLFVGFVLLIAPRFVIGFDSLQLPPFRFLNVLTRMGESIRYWGLIVPALLGFLLIRWNLSGRSLAMDAGPMRVVLDRLPVIGSMVRYYRSAHFAEMLALLVDHRVPLDEGIILASEASGDQAFCRSARSIAEALRRGERMPIDPTVSREMFPPMLAWILSAGHRQGDLSPALRHTAQTYRRKAETRVEILRNALPAFLMLSIGAVSVLLYGLLLFIPLTTLWNDLAIGQ